MCIIFLPVSEQTGIVDDLFSVDVNSSCYSIVTCSPMEPIQECTAYCGPSDNVTALTMDTGSGIITIQLPPATGDIYHCVVSGSRDDGTVVFRGRQQQTVRGEGTQERLMSAVFSHSGCSLQGLLSGTLMPECDINDDGSCSCTINASSDGYSVMYDGTSIEANAVYVLSSGYCYDGPGEDLTRMCEMTGAWTGEEPDPEDFIESNLTSVVAVCVQRHDCWAMQFHIR